MIPKLVYLESLQKFFCFEEHQLVLSKIFESESHAHKRLNLAEPTVHIGKDALKFDDHVKGNEVGNDVGDS